VDPVPDPLLLRKSGSSGNRTRDLRICSQEVWPLDHRGGQVSLILIKLNHGTGINRHVQLHNRYLKRKFWATRTPPPHSDKTRTNNHVRSGIRIRCPFAFQWSNAVPVSKRKIILPSSSLAPVFPIFISFLLSLILFFFLLPFLLSLSFLHSLCISVCLSSCLSSVFYAYFLSFMSLSFSLPFLRFVIFLVFFLSLCFSFYISGCPFSFFPFHSLGILR
jgi:hypothetical protein